MKLFVLIGRQWFVKVVIATKFVMHVSFQFIYLYEYNIINGTRYVSYVFHVISRFTSLFPLLMYILTLIFPPFRND